MRKSTHESVPARDGLRELLKHVDWIRLREIRILADDEVADGARAGEGFAELHDAPVAAPVPRGHDGGGYRYGIRVCVVHCDVEGIEVLAVRNEVAEGRRSRVDMEAPDAPRERRRVPDSAQEELDMARRAQNRVTVVDGGRDAQPRAADEERGDGGRVRAGGM